MATIRSLARAGHRVVATDCHRVSPGRWSRYASESEYYPDPLIDPAGAAKALGELAQRFDADLLIPVTDPVISALRSASGTLPERCRLAAADPEQLAMAGDKSRTVQIAQRVGVPVPVGCVVDTTEGALVAAAKLGWPVVLKPVSSVAVDAIGGLHKFEVTYAGDPAEVVQRMIPYEGLTRVLVQEYCNGHGVGIEVLADDGEILAAFAHRRIREVPITGGASSYRCSIPLDPDLLAHTEALIAELKWTGLAMVEFKMGPSGARLMEINGRLWGSLPLAVKAGVDFPALYVDLLNGKRPTARVDRYPAGVRSRNLEAELIWVGSVLRGSSRIDDTSRLPRRREAVKTLARLAWPADGYDILSLRDPAPGVAEVLRVVAKLAGKLGRS